MKKPRKSAARVIQAADLFCGAGGTSTGLVTAIEALGYDLDLLAVNHWQVAIDTHSTNHKQVRHLCQTLDTIDPRKVVPGGRLNILVASPECTHHSNARGGKPMSDQSRASAWLILNWLEKLYVENLLVENVKEFINWGPLGADSRPLKSKQGELFRLFVENLKGLGYRAEHRVLNAADYGDATTRERFFLMARRGNKAISWPEPTHASVEKLARAKRQPSMLPSAKLQPWRAAREVIDWSLEGTSIFNRKKPLAPNTMRRIFAGLAKYSGLPFVLPHQHGSSGLNNVRSADQPLPTVTGTSCDMFLAHPFVMPVNHGKDERTYSPDQPMPTVTSVDAWSVVEPYMIVNRTHSDAHPLDEPIRTLTTGDNMGLCEPYLVVLRNNAETRAVDEPAPTVCANGNHLAVAEPFLLQLRGGADKYARTRKMSEPVAALTTAMATGIVQPFVFNMAHATGEGGGGHGRYCYSTDRPLPTIDGQGRFGLVSLKQYLVKYYEGSTAADIDLPMPAITANYEHLGVASPYLIQFFGNSDDQSVDEPLRTVMGKDKFGLVLGLFIPQLNAVLDIKFRMLQPHELAAAMSFPKTYHFTGTREQKVKQIGNAVPVRLAEALCRSLLAAGESKKRRVA